MLAHSQNTARLKNPDDRLKSLLVTLLKSSNEAASKSLNFLDDMHSLAYVMGRHWKYLIDLVTEDRK
jgi:hypothetical protein